ncbi:hypothetical protein [Candidatus Rariloculus sp.]|uniref:hypothetical protein n=1 Tax=Candidatus Rariloculus sp. TaxID=3101265 RepID=UPI003D0E3767
MKKLLASLILLGSIALPMHAWSADQIIRLTECQALTQDDLHVLALGALSKRRYTIEEDTSTMIVGEQDDLKVEILIEADSEIVKRWKEGFGHRRDVWLRNRQTDILWALAE